jgi:Leucine-rich repeat (LRR) protein
LTTSSVFVAVFLLTLLQLGHNQLQQLPACVGQLTALTHLGLESNALQQIEPGALEGLVRLEVLQLQDNQLQQLPSGLGGRGLWCGYATGARGLSTQCSWLHGSSRTQH